MQLQLEMNCDRVSHTIILQPRYSGIGEQQVKPPGIEEQMKTQFMHSDSAVTEQGKVVNG